MYKYFLFLLVLVSCANNDVQIEDTSFPKLAEIKIDTQDTAKAGPLGQKLSYTIDQPVDLYVNEVRLYNSSNNSLLAQQQISTIKNGTPEAVDWYKFKLPQCNLVHKLPRYQNENGVFLLDKPIKHKVYVVLVEDSKNFLKLPTIELDEKYNGVSFSIPRPVLENHISIQLDESFDKILIDGANNADKAAQDFSEYDKGGCSLKYRLADGLPAGKYTLSVYNKGNMQAIKKVSVSKTARTGVITLTTEITTSLKPSWASNQLKGEFDRLCDNLKTTYLKNSITLIRKNMEIMMHAQKYNETGVIETLETMVRYVDNTKDLLSGLSDTSFNVLLPIEKKTPIIEAFVDAANLLLETLKFFKKKDSQKEEMEKKIYANLVKLKDLEDKLGRNIDYYKNSFTATNLINTLADETGGCIPSGVCMMLIEKDFALLKGAEISKVEGYKL